MNPPDSQVLLRRGALDAWDGPGEAPKYTHVCFDCGALGIAGGYHYHGGDDVGETIALDELPDAIRSLQRFECEAHELAREVERLQKVVDEMAQQLAFSVRIGTGVNLQATTSRGVLERHGYVVDRQGWLEGEAGYDPSAPPWKEDERPKAKPAPVRAKTVAELIEDDVVPF